MYDKEIWCCQYHCLVASPLVTISTMRQYKINFLNKYRRYCHACVYLRGGDICGFKLNDFYFQSRF